MIFDVLRDREWDKELKGILLEKELERILKQERETKYTLEELGCLLSLDYGIKLSSTMDYIRSIECLSIFHRLQNTRPGVDHERRIKAYFAEVQFEEESELVCAITEIFPHASRYLPSQAPS
jgi:hypothetical protein